MEPRGCISFNPFLTCPFTPFLEQTHFRFVKLQRFFYAWLFKSFFFLLYFRDTYGIIFTLFIF